MFTKLMNQLGKLPAWLEALMICILLVLATFLAVLWAVLVASKLVVGLATIGVVFYWVIYSAVKGMREYD